MQKSLCIQLVLLFIIATVAPCFGAFSADFATSDECTFCHTSGFSALIDGDGEDLSIADDWAPTMMANGFIDPVFRAKLESEVVRKPHLKGEIEDTCLTCHAPMARSQARLDGAGGLSLAEAKESKFAHDSVSCTLCHQIENDGLDDGSSFSGNFTIGRDRNIYGPYKDVFPNPMLHHVDYLPTYGEQVGKPELCASCHTLFTSIISGDGKVVGNFPEQTPYLEWLNSIYASAENYQSCQDCHMPRVNEPVKITNRPPWFEEKREPFWTHQFIGGNSFALKIIRNNRERLGSSVPEKLFDKAIARTRERLTQDVAEVYITEAVYHKGSLRLKVDVINNSGHKFPTGFPSRRAWLHLKVVDANDQILFQSGGYNQDGKIVGLKAGYEPHHTTISSQQQTQIYQAIIGDKAGKVTNTLLDAVSYLKDNRIPPAGFQQSAQKALYTGVKGYAASDTDFNRIGKKEGSGTDSIVYQVDLGEAKLPFTMRIELLYQSNNPQFLEDLFKDDSPAISRFKEMYSRAEKTPEVIDAKTYSLTRE